MENEILRVMDIFKTGRQLLPRDLKILQEQINNLTKANIDLMNEIKDHKDNAKFLCDYIKKNFVVDNYMINNLLKKYSRKETEITQNRKFNLY